jgi:hypothetical protein
MMDKSERKLAKLQRDNPSLWQEMKRHLFKEFETELEKEVSELKAEHDALVKEQDELKTREALRLKNAKIKGMLQALPREAVTEDFLRLLESKDNEADMKRLIESRVMLVETLRGSHIHTNGHISPERVLRFSKYGFE